MKGQIKKTSISPKIAMLFSMLLLSTCEESAVTTNDDSSTKVSVTSNIINEHTGVYLDKKFEINFTSAVESSTVILSSFFVVPDTASTTTTATNKVNDLCAPNQALAGSISCETNNLRCILTLEELLLPDSSYILCMLDQITFKDSSLGYFEGMSRKFTTEKLKELLDRPDGSNLKNRLTGELAGAGIELEGLPNGEYFAASDDPSEDPSLISLDENGNKPGLTVRVVGLTAGTLKLTLLSHASSMLVIKDGSFTFPIELNNGALFEVQIQTQPEGLTCVLENNTGNYTPGPASSTVTATCGPKKYSVSGVVTGLTGTLDVSRIGSEVPIMISENGPIALGPDDSTGANYSIVINVQPIGQVCSIQNANGVISSANVDNILITCASFKYIFLSLNTHHGDFVTGFANGIVGADAFCNDPVNRPVGFYPDVATYKALISDGLNRIACTSLNCSGAGASENLFWPLSGNMQYRQSGLAPETHVLFGTTNASGIFSGSLEGGLAELSTNAWTGLNNDWTSSTDDCVNWSSNAGGNSGSVGDASSTTMDAFRKSNVFCNVVSKLYCVQQ
jgi:hypothetical protein